MQGRLGGAKPQNLKEVKPLVGQLTYLFWFIPKLVERIKPILKIMKRSMTHRWDENYEVAFAEVKGVLANPLMMARLVY